jgi:queuine tRNA-ribosyltransferase
MPLDVCTPPGTEYRKALEASEITTNWARRSRETWRTTHGEGRGVLFGIAQGNFFKELRERSMRRFFPSTSPVSQSEDSRSGNQPECSRNS